MVGVEGIYKGAELKCFFSFQAEAQANRLKAQASMMAAVACAAVPKITIVIGGCFGSESYAMVRVSQNSVGLIIDLRLCPAFMVLSFFQHC